ncbi:hypothetical protein L873DRAFT_1457199 [Choiromyces venosus 120613-1]|uniref:Uncharacterized protein n=1 Tax=Choiromyces venosus 120613-1 TaxID=1336337 RepID=A0A3N4KEA8_9PEZI|nr:hypothetical protein L873DRAFT_1457199 [Choiromyces venosus 120613-1]
MHTRLAIIMEVLDIRSIFLIGRLDTWRMITRLFKFLFCIFFYYSIDLLNRILLTLSPLPTSVFLFLTYLLWSVS